MKLKQDYPLFRNVLSPSICREVTMIAVHDIYKYAALLACTRTLHPGVKLVGG